MTLAIHDPTHLYEGTVSPKAERLATVISAVTYPSFLAAVVFVILSLSADSVPGMLASIVISVGASFVAPTIATRYYSRKFGNGDGDVPRREDRMRPFLVGIMSYFAGVVLLYLTCAPWVCTAMMMSYATSTIIVLLISTKWKISVHATGFMGPATMMAIVYPLWCSVLLLFVIPVAWSRYVRRKHTPAQLMAGACFGAVYTALFMLLVL